ncbi:MAG: hypothetical protein IIT36_05355, partial [Aeriscardovia sp.]|nr:hypothetical protein [Aeriscardovia sp.]
YVAHAARWFDDIHLLTEVLQLPSDLRDVSHEDPDRLGSPERLRITLRQIRSREFSTRNAQLIDMLLALIDDTHAGVQRTLTATHLGIAPFDHVWEPLTSNRHRDPLGA